jgi:hypothetical protein
MAEEEQREYQLVNEAGYDKINFKAYFLMIKFNIEVNDFYQNIYLEKR